MGPRRGRSLAVLVSLLVGAAVGGLIAVAVFRESEAVSVCLVAAAGAAAACVGTLVRAARRHDG